MLDSLKSVAMPTADRDPCLPGTRQRLIKDVVTMLLDPSSRRKDIVWLYGLIGEGKSAFATSVANICRAQGRLGAFLFFDRSGRVAQKNPTNLIQTLAAQLAECDFRIVKKMTAALKDSRGVIHAPLAEQFTKLIEGPLKRAVDALDAQGPIVVVLDALDECGTKDSRKKLLSVLGNQLNQLPDFVRFLITSRKEVDIERMMKTLGSNVQWIDIREATPG